MDCLPRPIQLHKEGIIRCCPLASNVFFNDPEISTYLDDQKLDEKKTKKKKMSKEKKPTILHIYCCALHPFERDITWDMFGL